MLEIEWSESAPDDRFDVLGFVMTTLLRGKRLKPRTSEVAEALLLHTMTNELIM